MKKILSLTFLFIAVFNYMFGTDAVFYTVLKDSKVEKLSIQIIDKIDGGPHSKPLLLFKVNDIRLSKIGGVAEGMSGSPVFVDDKYIGAVAYGLADNPLYGLIYPEPKMENIIRVNKYTGKSVILTPVIGDISINFIGSITYQNGNNIYIKGHPFNNLGEISYYIKDSSINYILPDSNNLPKKIAQGKKIIGIINKDLKTGLSGKITKKFDEFKFNIIISENLSKKKISRFSMVKDYNTLSKYLEESMHKVMIGNLDHEGYKSFIFKFNIKKENKIILSSGDIIINEELPISNISNSLSEDILSFVKNDIKIIDFDSIDVEVKAYDDLKLAYVKTASIVGNKRVFKPGEEVELKLKYLLYQKGMKTDIIKFTLPKKLPLGNIEIKISFGSHKKSFDGKKTYYNLDRFINSRKNQIGDNDITVIFKNEYGEIFDTVIINYDKYFMSDLNYFENIIIDSYEASN